MDRGFKNFIRIILISISLGIWLIVLQNSGIIPSKKNVYVDGGNIEADINNTVEVNGSVNIDDEVDVNIRKVNGWAAANYYEYSIDGREFHSLGAK
jgi:hypothetical protein